ncbi:MAG: threonylcarbamoyl-AMP synthase [Proteobacteria bacterium]|nr:threonylcarbamoyl-AMP synthase [Pseudomonadota bacterium]
MASAKLLSLNPNQPDAKVIREAAAILKKGGLVAFPTETVYGLGGDATNEKAVAGIFAAKGRPSFNPLIAHVAEARQLEALVVMDDRARELAEVFWPGPLTLILPRTANSPIARLASAGLPDLAVRIPSHPVAQALLKEAGIPVAAPSANRSGQLSSTTPLHVMESLGENVDLILGAGRCPVGVESTILSLTKKDAVLLRPGATTREQIEEVIGPVLQSPGDPANTSAPGQLQSHYAPRARLRLNAKDAKENEALLGFGPDMGVKGGKRWLNLSPTGDLFEAAANLFSMLHELDTPDITMIAVMPVPETGLGLAINDRLRRAAAPRE